MSVKRRYDRVLDENERKIQIGMFHGGTAMRVWLLVVSYLLIVLVFNESVYP